MTTSSDQSTDELVVMVKESNDLLYEQVMQDSRIRHSFIKIKQDLTPEDERKDWVMFRWIWAALWKRSLLCVLANAFSYPVLVA